MSDYKFNPSSYRDQVAERKRAEIFWSNMPKQRPASSNVSFSGLVWIFWLAVIVTAALES